MIREQGTVSSVLGELAEVAVDRRGACGRCQAQGRACNALLVTDPDAPQTVTVQAENRVGARVGDQVSLTISETAFFKGSAIVYLFPVMMLLIGGLLGPTIAETFGLSLSENAASAMSGGFFFFCSLLLVWLYSHRTADNIQYLPRIERIIENEPDRPDDCRDIMPE